MTTTPDFEKMFELEELLNSEDQVRYIKALHTFADAVENTMNDLGVGRDDPRCGTLVTIAEDLLHARRDAEQEAMRVTEGLKDFAARLRAANKLAAKKGRSAPKNISRRTWRKSGTRCSSGSRGNIGKPFFFHASR
jgi:hypothetical protein